MKAVLLDRDGVLIENRHYVFRPRDAYILPGAIAALRGFKQRGAKLIVVTNQSGIARGYYAPADVIALHDWLNTQLAPLGAGLDALYFCPHHPSAGHGPFTRACDCRKPAPGLILRALAEHGLAPVDCVMIGDSESDTVAAATAGVRAIRFAGDWAETARMLADDL